MNQFHEQDLSGSDFRRVSLSGATFEEVRLTDVRMNDVDLSGTRIRSALLDRTRLSGAELVDVEISGEIGRLVVNGIDVGPLVEAELDRQMPQRALMRPDDADGFRVAWPVIERLWESTVTRARGLPEEALHAASTRSGRSSRPCATSASPPPLG